MNWFQKHALIEINSVDDRNIANEQIRNFENMAEQLETISRMVEQNISYARNICFAILNNKKMDSFPKIRTNLIAAYNIALDNPKKFSYFVKSALLELRTKIAELKRRRKEFSEKKTQKGLKDEG